MTTRATQKIGANAIDTAIVASGQTVTAGQAVKFASADGEVLNSAAATDLSVGIALDSGTAGQTVRYVRLGSDTVVPVRVGSSGTATRGLFAEFATAGVTNVTAGGGTNLTICLGQFVESGASNDWVGLNVGMAGPAVKS